jgi:nucleoside-diphosphate-sugar epimerase
MKKILVTGAGGFIGGHLVKELLNRGYHIRATDIKPFDEWYQCFQQVENLELDMTIKENCYKATEGMDDVINMACNMGGMGFIENNKAACMLSVLINTHLLVAAKNANVSKFFFATKSPKLKMSIKCKQEPLW